MSLDIQKNIINTLKQDTIQNIAIAMHNSPDGDCLGAAVALEKCLQQIGKNVDIIIHNKISATYKNIIGKHRINKYIVPNIKYDLTILLDCSDLNRTYENIKYLSDFLIVIDHHYGCVPIGDIYLYKPEASTGIIIYDIIKQLSGIDNEIATALYLTIRSDTNGFKANNTDGKSHIIAGKLIEYGADLKLINEIYENKNISLLKLMGRTFLNIIIDKEYKIIYLIIKSDDVKKSNSTFEEASSLIDYLREVNDIEVAILFMEGIDGIRVKARSKTFDVSNSMTDFGGGGHKQAAGALVWSKDIYSVAESVVRNIREKMKG